MDKIFWLLGKYVENAGDYGVIVWASHSLGICKGWNSDIYAKTKEMPPAPFAFLTHEPGRGPGLYLLTSNQSHPGHVKSAQQTDSLGAVICIVDMYSQILDIADPEVFPKLADGLVGILANYVTRFHPTPHSEFGLHR